MDEMRLLRPGHHNRYNYLPFSKVQGVHDRNKMAKNVSKSFTACGGYPCTVCSGLRGRLLGGGTNEASGETAGRSAELSLRFPGIAWKRLRFILITLPRQRR